MGDRGNIVIRDRGGEVFFYTHWNGHKRKDVLRRALAKNWRWDDGAYLARIIFCEMVKGQENEETGFGISTYICDNSYPLLIVDVDEQNVYERDPDDDKGKRLSPVLSFEEFVKDGDESPGGT